MSSRELLVGSAPRDREKEGPVHTETIRIIRVVTVMHLYTCLYTRQYTAVYFSILYFHYLTPIAAAKFLCPSLLVATNPKDIRWKKALGNPFTTTHEGKLLITEEGDKGQTLEQG